MNGWMRTVVAAALLAGSPSPADAAPPSRRSEAEIQKLLASQIDAGEFSMKAMGPLQTAAMEGNLKGVQALLKAGFDAKSRFVMPAFHAAASFLHWPVLKAFIDAGADVNIPDAEGQNVLFNVISGGYEFTSGDVKAPKVKTLPILKSLISAGAHVNHASQYEGRTPLMEAALSKSPERSASAKLLIESGANVNAVNKSGYSALIMAAGEGHEDVLKLLIKAGADVNAQSQHGNCALLLAARKGHANVVRRLIAAGADVNRFDRKGNSALTAVVLSDRAKKQAREEIVRQLIAAGANVDHQDQNGDYALLMVAKTKQKKLQKMLLDAGANPKLISNRGESAEAILP